MQRSLWTAFPFEWGQTAWRREGVPSLSSWWLSIALKARHMQERQVTQRGLCSNTDQPSKELQTQEAYVGTRCCEGT